MNANFCEIDITILTVLTTKGRRKKKKKRYVYLFKLIIVIIMFNNATHSNNDFVTMKWLMTKSKKCRNRGRDLFFCFVYRF